MCGIESFTVAIVRVVRSGGMRCGRERVEDVEFRQ